MSLSEHLNKTLSQDNKISDYKAFSDKRKRNIIICDDTNFKRKHNKFVNNKIRSTK
jgi:hypothetical protein